MKLSDEAYRQARALIASRLGLDFPETRRADLERGLMRVCGTSSLSPPETYLTWLASFPGESLEWMRLAGYLTVGETYFFRDRAVFEALEQQVLPPLIAARRAQGLLRLRLWSAGCATGEEPYSLAIVLHRLLPDREKWALTILGTDINPDALERARQGQYREWSLRETPSWIRDVYFRKQSPGTVELDARIRHMVSLAPLNLAADGYPAVLTNTSGMDLILCRNVLMYFTCQAQEATVARLQRALLPGGWLVLSPAEASVELCRGLVAVNFPAYIMHRNGLARETAEMTSGSLQQIPLSPWPDAAPQNTPAETVGASPTAAAPLVARLAEPAEFPSENGTSLQRARALADRGQLDEAGRVCEAALARDRLDPEAHLLLATICQEQGKISAALEALRRAIYLAPDSASAHFLLGALLIQQGEHDRGRRSMETVMRLLSSVPRHEAVTGGDGWTAGRLLETAKAYLDLSARPGAAR